MNKTKKGPLVAARIWVVMQVLHKYRKVASSSLSWLVAHFQIFRRLMKGKFDAYVL